MIFQSLKTVGKSFRSPLKVLEFYTSLPVWTLFAIKANFVWTKDHLHFRHAQDVREHYERKLERANNLYMELTACMLQLEKRERELIKYV